MKAAALLILAACGAPAPAPVMPANRETPAAETADRDDDGISDAVDRCPDVAEDFDLFEDRDGCPDPDDDHDGVLDDADACPYTPGVDGGGCPEGCVIVTDSEDCWPGPIWYDGGTTDAQLPEAAKVILANPEIREVTITGRWSGVEPVATAARRAVTVRDKLVALGVPSRKLAMITEPNPMPNDFMGKQVVALITKQRFAEGGQFRMTECTAIGGVVKPKRAAYSCHGKGWHP